MPAKAKKAAAEKASKKTEQKKKQKLLEDKTFGLKNKNKSKKVQQQIESVKKSVFNVDRRTRLEEERRKKQKEEAKERKKQQKAEQDLLFGEALNAIKKKNKNTDQKSGKTEAKGRDADDDGGKKGTSRAMKMMYQMDAQEMEEKLKEDPNYVPTLEDEIEAERQRKVAELKAAGKGTPVTEETFAAWKERKRKARAEQAKKVVEAEFKKKKGGKGLAVLSGRDLYEYKKELFNKADNDDENDAMETVEEQAEENTPPPPSSTDVAQVAEKVESELFLEGDDEDLDDLDDLEDD